MLERMKARVSKRSIPTEEQKTKLKYDELLLGEKAKIMYLKDAEADIVGLPIYPNTILLLQKKKKKKKKPERN